jgi:hypothetical protein
MHKQHARAENREESGFCEVSFTLYSFLAQGVGRVEKAEKVPPPPPAARPTPNKKNTRKRKKNFTSTTKTSKNTFVIYLNIKHTDQGY